MIDPDIETAIAPRLNPDENLLWADSTDAYKSDKVIEAQNSLGSIHILLIVAAFIPFFVLPWFFNAEIGRGMMWLLVVIVLYFLFLWFSVKERDAGPKDLIVGGYALTDQRLIQLGHKLGYRDCQPGSVERTEHLSVAELDRLWRRRLAQRHPKALPSDLYIRQLRKGETILWFGDAIPELRKKPPHRIKWIAGSLTALFSLFWAMAIFAVPPDSARPIEELIVKTIGLIILAAFACSTYIQFVGTPRWVTRRATMNHYMITDQRVIAFNRRRANSMELDAIDKVELSDPPGEYAMIITQKPGTLKSRFQRWDGVPDFSEARRIIKEKIG